MKKTGIVILNKSTFKCEHISGNEVRQCTFMEKMHCLRDIFKYQKGMSVKGKLIFGCKFIRANFTISPKPTQLGAL